MSTNTTNNLTIQEIITKLNYLEKNGKQIQKEKGDYYWLQEIGKWEDLFCNHPDADKTRHCDDSEYIKLEMI